MGLVWSEDLNCLLKFLRVPLIDAPTLLIFYFCYLVLFCHTCLMYLVINAVNKVYKMKQTRYIKSMLTKSSKREKTNFEIRMIQ